AADIDLDEARDALPGASHLFGEDARELVAINTLDHIEKGDRFACLVGLQWANEMEFEVWVALTQSWPLVLGLLHPVFPEDTLSRHQKGLNGFGAKGFRDGDQLHLIRRGTEALAGLFDPVADLFERDGRTCSVVGHLGAPSC